jgi:hypothetical protein
MARKRKKIWASEAERAAHEARVDEHLRAVDELVERHFADIGRPRPVSSLEYLEDVLARTAPGVRPADV